MADKMIAVGSTVTTPDGVGKVTKIGDRFISIDLANKTKAEFLIKEVLLSEKS